MASRPRRAAARLASVAITDMVDRDAAMSSRARRGGEARGAGRAPSADSNLSTVRVSGTAKRQKKSNGGATGRRDRSESHEVVHSHSRRPARGPKKRYVESESSEDDNDDEDEDEEDEDEDEEDEEDEEEEKDEIHVGASDVDMDAEGEDDDMDVDAEGDADGLGDEDAEGDMDMDAAPATKTSKAAATAVRPAGRPSGGTKATPTSKSKGAAARRGATAGGNGRKRGRAVGDEDEDEEEEDDDEDDDEDEELSEAESVAEGEINAFVEVAGDEEDAEGEEDDVANMEGETEMLAVDDDEEAEEAEDAEGDEEDEEDEEDDNDDEQDAEGDSDEGSRAGTPDLTKMTRRQRARFEETPQEYMKLSDEVQVKKVFTAEELSMRRQEMARRRRNLSDKRNEEVKAETINKLLKRQAPKTTKKNALADDEEGAADGSGRSAAMFIRWTSNKHGNRVGVKSEVLDSPIGAVFGPSAANSRPTPPKMVEEVA